MKNTYFLLPETRHKEKIILECWKNEIMIPEKNFVSIHEFKQRNNPLRLIFTKYDPEIKFLKEIATQNQILGGENINLVQSKNFYVPSEIDGDYLFAELKSTLKLKSKRKNFNKKDAKIALFYTPKGGVGKTQITQIAAELSHIFIKEDKKVLFVDANYAEGSFSERFLEYSYTNSLDMVINEYENSGNLKTILENAIVKNPEFAYQYSKNYNLKNVDVLFAPLSESVGIHKIFVNMDFFTLLFDNLKEMYDLIFIDTSNESMLPTNNYLFEIADYINFIINSDVYSVRQIIKFFRRGEDQINFDKCNIFANNFSEDYFGMSINDVVEKLLEFSNEKSNIKEVIAERLFHIPKIDIMVKVNNRQDGLFNPKSKYLKRLEKLEIIESLYKMYKKISPELIKDTYQNHMGAESMYGKIKRIFK
jgi:MinD-like ATPase involved in chromosome partitioning or flagellar assembly/ribosomal protein L33